MIAQSACSVWGGIFALISAFLWAVAAILFRRLADNLSTYGMNLGKGIIAVLCLGPLVLLTESVSVNNRALLFLAISGLLSITFGDTFFFMSLKELGPCLAVILTVLIPAATLFLAVFILHERLSIVTLAGILLTLLGVIFVLWERNAVSEEYKKNNFKKGIIYGFLSVFTCAFGIIFSKLVIISIPALNAAFIRQVFGVVGLIVWGALSLRLKTWINPFFINSILLKKLLIVSFFGTFLGTLFSLLALKYTDASIATTLNSTSPLFILPLSFFFLGEKTSLRAIIGIVIAMTGVSVVFFSGG